MAVAFENRTDLSAKKDVGVHEADFILEAAVLDLNVRVIGISRLVRVTKIGGNLGNGEVFLAI